MMSVTPLEVDQMSLFQFWSMRTGWQKFHCVDQPKPPSRKQFEERMGELGIELSDDDEDVDLNELTEMLEHHQ